MTNKQKRGNAAMKLVYAVCIFGFVFLSLPAMALPPEMEADRLLILAAKYTDQGKNDAAAAEFQKILDLKTKLPDDFYYQYGRHFYAIGQLKKAGENVETYLKKAGTKGQYYRQALQMLTAIEQRQKKLSRFVNHGDATVTDTKTGLMWAARDNGGDINWQNARAYCQRYSGGGHTDWRMPTQDELAGLYDPEDKNRHGYHVTELIGISACCPWASETRGSEAACFRFYNGSRGWYSPSDSYATRALPVRSGK